MGIWHVVKTGAEMFDAMHAYGLGIVLAHASGEVIALHDDGPHYTLESTVSALPDATIDLLDDVLKLPTVEQVHSRGTDLLAFTCLAVVNLDGLLAAGFTNPRGVRCLSVADLRRRQRFNAAAITQGLAKMVELREQWKMSVIGRTSRPSGWVHDLLQDYDPTHLCIPRPVPVTGARDITIPMTLDPSLSYASRRPWSDEIITRKTNMTMHGTRFAALLAYIGAARFLRAQQVTGNLINYYLPLAHTLSLSANTAVPLLSSAARTAEHALVLQWLAYGTTHPENGTLWKGLAYQTMQMGARQPIARSRGCLDLAWLHQVQERAGKDIVMFWKAVLRQSQDAPREEMEPLLEALASHRLSAWIDHLFRVAQTAHSFRKNMIRLYSLVEVKEVTTAMDSLISHPLSAILERKEGTLRFGHALRLLYQYNPSAVREAIEELETVQTRDQLIDVLGGTMQVCQVAAAKPPNIMLVPSDPDLKLLLDDVDQYGAHTIAGLLILLSALHYPHRDDPERYTALSLWRVLTALLAALTPQINETEVPSTSGTTAAELPASRLVLSSNMEGDVSLYGNAAINSDL